MKKKILALLLAAIALGAVAGCDNSDPGDLKVAYITDGSLIDANGINRGIWSTLTNLNTNIKLEVEYSVPKDTKADTLKAEIKKLVDKGYNMIVLPGRTFEGVLQDAQILHKDTKFVALDFAPQTLGESCVSIDFDAHEAGFVAGFAAAIKLEQARFGAILGEEVLAYQEYSWGFQQGVIYANENMGTRITMSEADFIYSGTSTDALICQQIAAQLYDKGVDCIFIAAGSAGSGALIEAKLRRANGADIWAVGSEYNQFSEGVYDGNNSVVITSAIKYWSNAMLDMIEAAIKGSYPGQKTITYSAGEGGVGIPGGEYNLTVDMRKECEKITDKISKGDIKVYDTWFEGLIK